VASDAESGYALTPVNTRETKVAAVTRYRFGPYEVDLERNELRKSGLRIKLEPKPLQILLTLLDRTGEVVTRAELQDLLWGEGVFVDFEKGLNVAVTKLRAALSDSSEKPKYIATIAGEGYRFVAEVQRVFAASVALTSTNGSQLSSPHSPGIQDLEEHRTLIPLNGGAAASVTPARLAAKGFSELRVSWMLVASATLLVIAAALAWFQVADHGLAPTVANYIQISNDARTKISPRGNVPMATDGARLYYSEISNNFRLIEVSSSGGESVEVPSPLPSNFLLGISPDHTQLLVQDQTAAPSEMPFWALPLVGGTAHKLGNILGQEAAWSLDGRWLAFSKRNELFLATAQGTDPRKLTSLQGPPESIRWSPDSSKLRFSIQDNKSDSRSLWEVSADGSNLHPLLPNWSHLSDRVPGDTSLGGECCGTWTPDGRYFFFQSARGGRNDIWVIRENRGWFPSKQSEPVRLTSGAQNYTSPLPSLDGKKLFVVASLARGELTRYDVHSKQFVSYLSGISAEGVDFSRDGQWITYVSYPDGTLWRSKLDGTQRLQLTVPPMRAFLPRWAPDGRRVAFAGKLPGKTYDIYVVSADDGAPEQLTNGEHDYADVSWSADGKQLIFGEMFSVTDSVIHLLDLQTKKISMLPASKGRFSPRWSPDGRYVAAIPATPQDKIVLYDFQTNRWSDLAKVIIGSPTWSKDSKYIYFDTEGKGAGLNRIRVSDHKLERFTSLEHVRLAPVWWSGVSPDGSPLILRDVGTEEIYALDLQFR
jgi:Tol biopolymer transport system component/DNA-binding winged helix-turn-helix (wHTH) protein